MKRFALVCLLALVLTACGDDKSDQEKALDDLFGGKGGTFPGAVREDQDPRKMWEQMGQIELTDEMMGNYVKLIEKMKSVEGRPDAALLQAYSLNWQQWAAIGGAVARAQMATGKSSMVANLEKQLEKARKQLAEAPEERKEGYRRMVAGYEESLANLKKNLPDATDRDRKNQAVVDRWMDRIKAAGRSK